MNIIAPIALILASLGIFFGYINPTYTATTGSADAAGKSITELQSEEKDYNDALTKTAAIEEVRSNLAKKFDAISPDDVAKIEKMLPDHIDSVRLIIDINNIAAKYGMALSAITLSVQGSSSGSSGGKSQPVGGALPAQTTSSQFQSSANQNGAVTSAIGPDSALYDSVQLGFSVSGSYDNFLRFLGDLERSLRIVDVVSLSFGAGQSGSGGQSAKSQNTSSDSYNYSMTIRTYYLK